jgi:uncharacterized protein YfkK (UPF0435 family)
MLSLIQFWKEGLIALLAGLLWFAHTQNNLLTEEVKMNKAQYQEYKGKYEDVQQKLDIINQSIIEQQARFKSSEAERLKIIATLNTQVTSLRKQQVPKECQAAVDYAVTNKGDLGWPK